MPAPGFGCYRADDTELDTVIAHATAAGYRSFDTAAMYGNETALGRALARPAPRRVAAHLARARTTAPRRVRPRNRSVELQPAHLLRPTEVATVTHAVDQISALDNDERTGPNPDDIN